MSKETLSNYVTENYEKDGHKWVQRVACYVRVSTNEQKLRGLSPDAQRSTLETYAKNNNLKIVEWYEDLGISGRKLIKNRPALQRMILDAEAGKFERIIFIKLDRYFRSVAEYYECQKRLEAKNVLWTATEEHYDLTTANGRYWVTQKLAMAQYEAEQTGERIDMVNEYKIKTGQPLTGSANQGYGFIVGTDQDGHKKVIHDPDTRDIVIDYIDHYLTYQNKRQAYIFIKTKYDTSASYNTLSKILTNTKIYGHYRGNDNYCDPYIDKDTWNKLQAIQTKNIKAPRSKRVYLFTGLVNCPECGYNMASSYCGGQSHVKRNGKVYKYNREYYTYRCNHAYKENKCTYIRRPSEIKLEAFLLDQMEPLIHSYIKEESIADNQPKTDGLDQRIKDIKSEMTNLNTMFRKNRITEKDYDKEYDELESQLKELESHMEPIKERDLTIYKDLLKNDWKSIYSALDRENKRAFWRKYVKAIIVDDLGRPKDAIFF